VGDDVLVRLARDRLGDYYADRQLWDKAIPLYCASGNAVALAEAEALGPVPAVILGDLNLDPLPAGLECLLHLGGWLDVGALRGQSTCVSSGAVAGLVAITPACGFVSQMASLVIGFVAAILAFHTERTLRARLPLGDDTLACFTGHGVGGMLGIFATGLCASVAQGAPVDGAVYSGNGTLLGWQCAGIVVTVVMSTVGTSVAWGVTVGLLTALGVPRGQVLEDYALTEKIMDFEAIARNTASVGAPPPAGFDSIAKLSPEVRAPMIRSDPAYLQAAFAAIERREGSVANFLDNRVGVSAADIRGLRQGLLKPV
jgi:Amt family ammonium transporter